MKSITPKSAIPGTIDADQRRVQFVMDSVEAEQFCVSDRVLVTGFSDHGFRDGMTLFAYSRSLDPGYRTVLVIFYRQL